MSERFNRNDAKFARAIQRQEGQSWLRRQKENLDRRSQTIAEQMRGVFSGYMMTPAAVLAGEVVAARYQYGDAYYGAAYRTAELAYRGGNGDPWKMFTGALASSEGKKREGGRISIEGRNLFYILCLLILASMILGACTPPPAGAQAIETGTPTDDAPTLSAPTESVHEIPTIGVPATPAGELTPEVSPTDEPTVEVSPTDEPAPTEMAVPDHMQEYCELGYDNPSDGGLYVVVDESKVHFSDINGIVYNERVIRSWYEVDYIDDNGVLQHGFVLGYIRRGGTGSNADFTKLVTSNSGALIENPSVAFVQTMENGTKDMSPSAFPIYRAILGVEQGDWASEHLFDGLFPVVDGVPQPITIPGIGRVLPITRLELVDTTVQASKP